MYLMTRRWGRILVFIGVAVVLTACNSRSDTIEGVVRISTDLVEYELRTTTEDDNCWSFADEEVSVRAVYCEDWLTLIVPIPERSSEFTEMEIGKTYEAATRARLKHSEKRPSETFDGIDPGELQDECDLSQQPTGTITRVDESPWKRTSSDWGGVFDLEFEHGCISGTLRYYRNIDPD
jgi:hypothetical protein